MVHVLNLGRTVSKSVRAVLKWLVVVSKSQSNSVRYSIRLTVYVNGLFVSACNARGLLYRSKQSPLLSVGEGGSGVRPEDSELNLDGIDDKEIDMVYDELTHNLAALSLTHLLCV